MSIRSRAITALRWRLGTQFTGQIVAWAAGLLVVRLLKPEDLGLMATATLLVGLAQLASQFGLDAVVVQSEELRNETLQQAFGAILVCNAILFLILWFSAERIAEFYGWPLLSSVVRILSFQLLIDAMSSVPVSLLARNIDFKALSIIEMGGGLARTLVALLAAILGYGVWALVWGALTASALRTAGVLALKGAVGPPSFRLRGFVPELRFGASVLLTKLLNYASRRIDVLIVGKILGQEILGAYTLGTDLSRMPSRTIMPAVQRVMLPFYSRLQNDPHEAAASFVRSAETLCLVLVPLFWGLSAVAPEFVLLVLGSKWENAAVVLRWICLVMPLRSLERLLPSLARGFGREDLAIRNAFTVLCLAAPAVLLGTRWGLTGVAVGWAIAVGAATIVNLRRTLPLLRCSARGVLATVATTFHAGLVMYGVVLGASWLWRNAVPLPLRVCLLLIVAAGTYGSLIAALNRSAVVRTWRLVRGA